MTKSPRKNAPDVGIELGAACMPSGHASDRATVEQRYYDIGIEQQSTCSVPPVETSGIMLPNEEYLTLLRSLNLSHREFFNHAIHWIKCKDEPIYAFLIGGASVGKSVAIRALYQSLYNILNLRDGENPDDIRILLCCFQYKWSHYLFCIPQENIPGH